MINIDLEKERESESKKGTERESVEEDDLILVTWMQQPGLHQVKAKGQEFHPGLIHRWEEPKYLGCSQLPSRVH